MAAAGGTGPRERTPTGTFSADALTFNEDSAQHRRMQNQCKKVEKDNEALNKQLRELKKKHKDELADVERITAGKSAAEAQVQTLKDEMAEFGQSSGPSKGCGTESSQPTHKERGTAMGQYLILKINNEALEPQAKADAIE
jgi:TolA-binding protein